MIGTGRRGERLNKLQKELGASFLPLPFDVENAPMRAGLFTLFPPNSLRSTSW